MVRPVTPVINAGADERPNNSQSILDSEGFQSFQSFDDSTYTVGRASDIETPDASFLTTDEDELEGAVGFSSYSSLDQSKLVDQNCTETELSSSLFDHSVNTEQNYSESDVTISAQDTEVEEDKKEDLTKKDETDCCSEVDDGVTLYEDFLREEFRRQNLQPPCLNPNAAWNSRMRMGAVPNGDVIQAGLQLRAMSERFMHTPMRQWVQQQADSVPLETLDFNSFSDLLYGLFQEGGVTWERVVVLFFFCADLSIRAFRERMETQFKDILEWSFRFISGAKFKRWVETNGGWTKILQDSMDQVYKMAVIGFCAMGMLAFAAYLWRNK